MAVVKRQDADKLVRGAMVLDLGDLAREGRRIRERSSEDAQRIVDEARAERERTVAGAAEAGRAQGFEDGHAKGYAEGLQKGRAEALAEARKELESVRAAWASSLQSFEAQREALLEGARRDALRLAVLFAEKITKRAVAIAPEAAAEEQLRSAMTLVVSASRLTVRCHPKDAASLRSILPGLASALDGSPHAEIVEDDAVGRGSCVVALPGGAEIDATVQTQLDRLANAVLPERRVPDLAVAKDDERAARDAGESGGRSERAA